MSKENQTLLRQWAMLRSIPRYPIKITAGQLTDKLKAESFDISKRTVERDLVELSRTFPLSQDDRNKPYGWSWAKDAPSFDLPGLSLHEALMLVMAEDYINKLLPSVTTAVLSPHFAAARQVLETQTNQIARWKTKVRSINPNQTLIAPIIEAEVQRVVTTALLEEKQLEIHYQKLGEKSAQTHRIHPLGLVHRGNLSYLVATYYEYDDICLLATHRIKSAKQLEQHCNIPNGFDLDHEIARGRLDFGSGESIKLVVEFKHHIGEYFYETPISRDQVIEVVDRETMRITATVSDTPQLMWWLLGFGAGVKILEPLDLKLNIIKSSVEVIKQYE